MKEKLKSVEFLGVKTMTKLWEIWDYRGGVKLVAVVKGRKYAVDKAKQLAPSAIRWFDTHKIFPSK